MIATIHQPEHLPWLGFIHKATMADVLVLLDNVQYRKNYYQNRNKIRTHSGFSWLTVPVKKHPLDTSIKDVMIDNTKHWKKKCWKTLSLNYKNAPYFSKYSDFFFKVYSRDWELLAELNIEIIRQLFTFFDIKIKLIKASNLNNISGKGDDLLLTICKELRAKKYLSGISGREYMNAQKFERSGITVTYQEFFHPIYHQCYQPFIPCLSALDLLFNLGDKSKEILLNPKSPRLKYLIE